MHKKTRDICFIYQWAMGGILFPLLVVVIYLSPGFFVWAPVTVPGFPILIVSEAVSNVINAHRVFQKHLNGLILRYSYL